MARDGVQTRPVYTGTQFDSRAELRDMKRVCLSASRVILAVSLAFGCGSISSLFAQNDGETRQGAVERIKVHGKALEGNLEGDPADRDVSIYLPPSYLELSATGATRSSTCCTGSPTMTTAGSAG